MSTSQFKKPLVSMKNLGFHLLLACENKDSTYTIHSVKKSYDIKEDEFCDKVDFKDPILGMTLAKTQKNWFSVAVGDHIELYKVIKETGDIIFMNKFKADFHPDQPKVLTSEFGYGNDYIVTGGNDSIIKVWKFKIDKEKDIPTQIEERPVKITSHTTPISKTSVTFDHDLIASIGSSDEKRCLVHDFKKGILLSELTFSERENDEFFGFNDCTFSYHRKYLYTLVSLGSRNSYVAQWDVLSGNFENLTTIKVHNGPCKQLCISMEGFYLGIGSCDGYVKSLNTRYMEVDRDDKFHDGEISDIEFSVDTRFILTCDNKGSYSFVPNMRAPGYMRFFFQYLMLAMFSYYIYKLIVENFF